MGWEGIHLLLFRIRAVSYGSSELGVHSPDIAPFIIEATH